MAKTATLFEVRLRTKMETRFGPGGRWLIAASSPTRSEAEREYQQLVAEFPASRADLQFVRVQEDAATGLQRDTVLDSRGEEAEQERRRAPAPPRAEAPAARPRAPVPERVRQAAPAPVQAEKGNMGWWLAGGLALAMVLLAMARL